MLFKTTSRWYDFIGLTLAEGRSLLMVVCRLALLVPENLLARLPLDFDNSDVLLVDAACTRVRDELKRDSSAHRQKRHSSNAEVSILHRVHTLQAYYEPGSFIKLPLVIHSWWNKKSRHTNSYSDLLALPSYISILAHVQTILMCSTSTLNELHEE